MFLCIHSLLLFQVVTQEKQDELLEEFAAFPLTPDDELPAASTPDEQWAAIGKLQVHTTASLLFPHLSALAKALLCIPNSNAAPERTFSMVRKIFTEQRADMHNEALSALLKCKLNTDDDCTQFAPSERMLQLARTACSSYNELCASSARERL